jgi:hypothetical protein
MIQANTKLSLVCARELRSTTEQMPALVGDLNYDRRKEPILRPLNVQLQRQRICKAMASFHRIIFFLKTHYAIGCVVNFYNAGGVTRDRRVGSGGEFFKTRVGANSRLPTMSWRLRPVF